MNTTLAGPNALEVSNVTCARVRYLNAQKIVLNENSREFSFDAPVGGIDLLHQALVMWFREQAFADHGNIPIEHLLRLEQGTCSVSLASA